MSDGPSNRRGGKCQICGKEYTTLEATNLGWMCENKSASRDWPACNGVILTIGAAMRQTYTLEPNEPPAMLEIGMPSLPRNKQELDALIERGKQGPVVASPVVSSPVIERSGYVQREVEDVIFSGPTPRVAAADTGTKYDGGKTRWDLIPAKAWLASIDRYNVLRAIRLLADYNARLLPAASLSEAVALLGNVLTNESEGDFDAWHWVAQVFTYGGAKYGEHNWRDGIR